MAIQYRSLDRSLSEVRLLRILPHAPRGKDKLIPVCELLHTSLLRKPQYVALSYVWGDQTGARVILVDDSPVRVTTNLYDAIMALRTPSKYLDIWIDFLCINQKNDPEKNWQVELMTDIYRQATQVYAWLGQADRDSDRVMDYLNSFGERAEACGIFNVEGSHMNIWESLVFQRAALRDSKQSIIMVMEEDGAPRLIPRNELDKLFYSISGWHQQDNLIPLAGMQRLFERPFWGRIWILQEISLPDNAQFVCGTRRISRRRCSAAINAYAALWILLMRKFQSDPSSFTQYHCAITTKVFHYRPTVLLSSWRIFRYCPFPLAAFLRATCVGSINLQRHGPHHFESTDPRDKIFALLSLASDREDLRQRGVFPDYSKSCAEVYSLAMAAMLEQGHMSLLSFCQRPKIVRDIPSWVPDWSRSATDMLQDVENDHITLYPTFNAFGVDGPHHKLTIRRFEGSIRGISMGCRIYDEIYTAGIFPQRASSHEVPLHETYSWPIVWFMEILRLSYDGDRCYKSFKARLLAVARSSTAGVGRDAAGRLAKVRNERFPDAVWLVKHGKEYITTEHIKRDIQRFMASDAVRDVNITAVDVHTRLGAEIIGKSLGRLPFVTRKGHLVVSSEHVKPGDFVVLANGVQVPLILRRSTYGTYELISEAYVDGIMDGQAADDAEFAIITLV